MSTSDPRYLSVPFARLADGIVCLPDGVERIVHQDETLWYLGMSPTQRPMMVVARDSG